MNTSPILQILDLARWAPSGDNTQPWRFDIVSDRAFVIYAHDTRQECVYDLDGHPSQISVGALIESAAIAATAHGLVLQAQRRDGPEERPVFDVSLESDPRVARHPLVPTIPRRSVQRALLSTRPLSDIERAALEASVGPGYSLVWKSSPLERLGMAKLLYHTAGLRAALPEAYSTHAGVIDWNARYSRNKIPAGALGADRLTLRLMRSAMASWERMDFLNRKLGGSVLPRIEMDFLPGFCCAAHLAIVAERAPASIDDYVSAGRAVQRLWLTATQLNLHHQPAITPLVFSRYLREGRRFTARADLEKRAALLAARLESVLDGNVSRAVWLGRIGAGQPAQARSARLSLRELLVQH